MPCLCVSMPGCRSSLRSETFGGEGIRISLGGANSALLAAAHCYRQVTALGRAWPTEALSLHADCSGPIH